MGILVPEGDLDRAQFEAGQDFIENVRKLFEEIVICDVLSSEPQIQLLKTANRLLNRNFDEPHWTAF